VFYLAFSVKAALHFARHSIKEKAVEFFSKNI